VRPVVDGELEFPETLDKDRLTLALLPEGASGPIRVGADGESASSAQEAGTCSGCPRLGRPKSAESTAEG
jgi:hypothetical protein